MVVIVKSHASEEEVEAVITNLNAFGFDYIVSVESAKRTKD